MDAGGHNISLLCFGRNEFKLKNLWTRNQDVNIAKYFSLYMDVERQ